MGRRQSQKLAHLWLVSLFVVAPFFCMAVDFSQEDLQELGRKIWENEAASSTDGLTAWNDGEDFASLGIGHFIWYPEGRSGPFKESFPSLLLFFIESSIPLPTWLKEAKGAPWNSREEFFAAFSSPQMQELRCLLKETIPQQVLFIIRRFNKTLPALLAPLPPDQQAAITRKWTLLTNSKQGLYAIVDYINFKGEGIATQERYQGHGWGLLQVLEAIPNSASESTILNQFIAAAKDVLLARVNHAPIERHEERWLKGWYRRLDSYAN